MITLFRVISRLRPQRERLAVARVVGSLVALYYSSLGRRFGDISPPTTTQRASK